MDIEGMETGMATGIGGRWRRAWRRAAMDDGGHATGMHEGVDGDQHERTMATGMDEGEAEKRRLRRSLREQQAHGTCHGSLPPSQLRPLPPLSLHIRILLGQCMLPSTLKRAPHLPNTTMPTQSCLHLQLGRNTIT